MSYLRRTVTRLTMDMSLPDVQKSVSVTEGDTNRRWEITLTNRGSPFELPPDWTAILSGVKPDGTAIYNGCVVDGGRIVYDFEAEEQLTAVVGVFAVQFDIFDQYGDIVASPKLGVNVYTALRPMEKIKSSDALTVLQQFVADANQIREAVDNNGDAIAALKEKVTAMGTFTVPASEWSDAFPRLAYITIPGMDKGSAVLLAPKNDASQIAAKAAKLYAKSSVSSGHICLQRGDEQTAPIIDIEMSYIVVKTSNDIAEPMVFLGGVDAYGEGGGTNGVDADAVKQLIREVVPAWAMESKPPEDAVKSVNGQTGDVKIQIPEVSKDAVGLGNVANERQYSAQNPPPYPVTSVNNKTGAVTISADPAGTASTAVANHNRDNAAHIYIQQRIDALYTRVENFLDIDEETFDQLSEVLADIQANASALELLGTGKIDKSKISVSFTDTAPDMVASVVLINELERLIGELESKKQTEEQVSAAISNALTSYITSVKAAELYQPKGNYITEDTADQRYANRSDIPTIPTALKNPHKITILGKEYDGSSAVSVSVEDILKALPASEEVAV